MGEAEWRVVGGASALDPLFLYLNPTCVKHVGSQFQDDEGLRLKKDLDWVVVQRIMGSRVAGADVAGLINLQLLDEAGGSLLLVALPRLTKADL